MPIAEHSRKFPSIRCLFPDIGESRGGVELLRAIGALLVEAMCSDLHGSVAGNREDLNALFIERPMIFGPLRAALLEGVHHPVVTRDARGIVEKLEIRAEAATELGDVAGVVGVEQLPICR